MKSMTLFCCQRFLTAKCGFGQGFLTKSLFFLKLPDYGGEYVIKSFPIVFIAILLISSLIVVGGVLLNPTKSNGKLYTFPLSVAENTYVVTVRSNYTSAPEVGYYGLGALKLVSIDFMGDPETAFCNVTIPDNLLWGELSVISKYYEMPASYYTKTSNSTHTSFYFVFDQIALIKHFEIRGPEGVSGDS
jgi:hypothetical protein